MNTQTETNAAPYLSYYGMVREPFGQAIEDDLFYAEPNRKQKLDILLHLTQYGNELMLVTGPTGSGKTTLLQQFQRKAPDSWRLARIEAKGGIDERRLVQQLYHQLGMEYQGASHADLVENLEHHLDALQRNARQAIMLIDDAEQLPVTALKWVLQMAELSNAEKKPLLRVILFGTDKLNENFADPILDYHADIVRRSLELGPLDREQTAHYILHRLSAAQFAASEPFTDAALHKLHRQSAGWPGRINNLAHKLLIDTLPSATAATGVKASSTVKPLRILAAIVISGIIGALLIFQDEVNRLFNPTPKATTASSVPAPAQDTSPMPVPESSPSATQDSATPLATDDNSSEPLIAAQETTTPATETAPADITEQDSISPIHDSSPRVAETESLPAAPAAPATEPSPPLTSEQIASEPAAPEPAAAEPVIPEPVLAKKMTPPAAAATAKPAPAKHAEPSHDLPTHDNHWLLAQDASHYTLQLVAGKKLATIRQYINETLSDETELQQHLALYRSQRQGKPWFGLVLGDYPDKQAAIDARSRLPQALRRATPWVRRLGAIQHDLRQP
jgi:DamX protein